MKRFVLGTVVVLSCAGPVAADTFGTGDNVFTIDFVPISASTNPTRVQATAYPLDGYGIVNYDYRMGVYEITNEQWDKFEAELGVPVMGVPWYGYDDDPYWTAANRPTNNVSWCEAAQFVNWLNTSAGYPPAYKFTGTQGHGRYDSAPYTLAIWSPAEAAGGTNLYRHKDAFYFLPTEDEWFKAAYWNGTTIQNFATKPGEPLTQGNGTSGTGWNYAYNHFGDPQHPWNVGSGSEELNGTYDMMGNVWEWIESPVKAGDYTAGSHRVHRGGDWGHYSSRYLKATADDEGSLPGYEVNDIGFRVASMAQVYAPVDFDGDGNVDLVDLNLLTAEANLPIGLAVPPADAKFDLTGDDLVGSADLDLWLADAATINGFASPYLKGDANLDGDVDVWQFDGSGDAQVLTSNLGTITGAVWGDGDFNGDGDVDVWAMDSLGDAQFLASTLGSANDAPASTVEAIYNAATGDLTVDVGEGIAVMGIMADGMKYDAVDSSSLFGAPGQNGGNVLAYFNTAGLTVGIGSVGPVLPAGLTEGDISFSYTPIGGQTTVVPVTVVPEPSTLAMLGVLLAIALCWRRRSV